MTLRTLTLIALFALQAPPRDVPNAPRSGSASISGIVVTADRDARPFDSPDRALAQDRPVRRARVFLNDMDGHVGDTIVTGDDGRFEFQSLAAGRYTVGAHKDGFITAITGGNRAGSGRSPVVVAKGESVMLTLRMIRGSVITGTVLDQSGQPAVGYVVEALRLQFSGGDRRPASAGHGVSDDRGTYRIYELRAGEYLISVAPSLYTRDGGLQELHVMTEAEYRQALDELRGGTTGRGQPGGTGSGAAGTGNDRLVTFAPVFFPGTADRAQAATLTLGEEEERTGIDFQAKLTPISRISGTLVLPPGVPPASVDVALQPMATTAERSRAQGTAARADGSFSFGGIVPGAYAVIAVVAPRPASPSPALWALSELDVSGRDITDVVLALQPALTVSGRVVFEGSTPPPANLATVLVGLHPMRGILEPRATTVSADVSGRFTMTGVLPGRYKLAGGGREGGPGPTGWHIKSAVVEGRDTMDFPIDLRRSVDDAVVTFADRTTEVSGVVRDAEGKPVGGMRVIVAAADRTFWNPNSRHIHTAQPGTDGKFSIRGSPPGDYFIGAVADIDEGEWYAPTFLERFIRTATRITLAEGQILQLGVWPR